LKDAGFRRRLSAAAFLASLAATGAAVAIEGTGHARLAPAEARVRARDAATPLEDALEREAPSAVEPALARLPFDARPRRWLARILAGAVDGDRGAEAALRTAVSDGLDRRPRDPVLLYLAGEAALRAGNEAEADRLREAAVRVGSHEPSLAETFARERLAAARTRVAAAAASTEHARRTGEAGDAEAARTLLERAARERAAAQVALRTVLRLRDGLPPAARARGAIEAIAAEAERELRDLGTPP
jgi:hypothetical protein